MKSIALAEVLAKHAAWLQCEPGGERVNLRGADLRGADLYGANLSGANLYGANLRGADLYGANLRSADLYGANLRSANLSSANLYGANLRGADLYGADLRSANLSSADLSETCLDPAAAIPSVSDSGITGAGLEIRGDRVYGWRTARSLHVGATSYAPGQSYTAPWFSVASTDCHPGIYFASAAWLDKNVEDSEPRVRCWCLRSDLHFAGGKFRCRTLHVVADGE